jgi:excisionase family DNA binding protein
MMKSVLTYPNIFNDGLNYGEIMENRLLTSSEVAEWLNMDEATVQRMSRAGELPAVKIGGRYRFRQADLDEWFNEQVKKGNGDGGGKVL